MRPNNLKSEPIWKKKISTIVPRKKSIRRSNFSWESIALFFKALVFSILTYPPTKDKQIHHTKKASEKQKIIAYSYARE